MTEGKEGEGIEPRPVAGDGPPPKSTREEIKEKLSQMRDGSFGLWAWVTAAWYTILGLSLLVFPRLFLFLSAPYNIHTAEIRETMTLFDRFTLMMAGIVLLGLAISLVASIPSPTPITRAGVVAPSQTHPLIGLSFVDTIVAFQCYKNKNLGALGLIRTFACGITGLLGFWVFWKSKFKPSSKKRESEAQDQPRQQQEKIELK